MEIDYDSLANELLFTFSPHGCQFSSPAMIRLDYNKLGVEMSNLYYIEDDGTYTSMQPNQMNTHGKWVMIYVNHFSRYALAAD